jgi:dephospho-CoA kinase
MIIGLAGTMGAGKGTIAEYLHKKHNFAYFSIRNFYAGEVASQGFMINKEAIKRVADELRAKHGPTWVIEQLLSQALHNQSVVIESLRSKEEVQYLKSRGAVLWVVDADIATRYKRTATRDTASTQTPEEFAQKDVVDKDALKEVFALADTTIPSEGTREQLYSAVEEALAKIPKI